MSNKTCYHTPISFSIPPIRQFSERRVEGTDRLSGWEFRWLVPLARPRCTDIQERNDLRDRVKDYGRRGRQDKWVDFGVSVEKFSDFASTWIVKIHPFVGVARIQFTHFGVNHFVNCPRIFLWSLGDCITPSMSRNNAFIMLCFN